MTFWNEALPYAQQAHAETNVLVSVVLSQWADETGYRWPAQGNNPGNVGNTAHGGQVNYDTVQDGVNAYIQTMSAGYYTAVRTAKTWQAQCYALGMSPWAGGHYHAAGGPPGNDLVKIIQANDLTQYDGASPAPAPPPAPVQEEDMAFSVTDPTTGGVWFTDTTGALYAEFGAPDVGNGQAQLNTHPEYHAGPCVGIFTFQDKNDEWGVGYYTASPSGGTPYSFYRYARDGSPD